MSDIQIIICLAVAVVMVVGGLYGLACIGGTKARRKQRRPAVADLDAMPRHPERKAPIADEDQEREFLMIATRLKREQLAERWRREVDQ